MKNLIQYILFSFVFLSSVSSVRSQTPLILNFSQVTGSPGDLVCVDVTTTDFTNVLSLQYSVNWNASVLAFSNVTSFNTTLGLNASTFSLPVQTGVANAIAFSWFDNTSSTDGISLPNGALLFRICFTIIGAPGTTSPFVITSNPVVKECIKHPPGGSDTRVPTNTGTPGGITVVPGTTAPLELTGSIQNAQPNDLVCVDIRANKFIDINSMMFSIHFDKTKLTYNYLNNFPSVLSAKGLGTASFDVSQAANGLITVSWTSSSNGTTLPDGTTIFSICFTATGAIGSFSDISIDGIPVPKKITNGTSAGANIGLTTTPGRVNIISSVLQPTIKVGSSVTEIGDPTCIDFTVKDFSLISELQFSINYDPTKIRFDSTSAYNLPGMTAADFTVNTAAGTIVMHWISSQGGVQRATGASIFKICFTAIKNIGDVTPITISNNPAPYIAISTLAGGADVGLTKTDGTVTLINPVVNPLVVSTNTYFTDEGLKVCAEVSVQNFKQMTGVQFSINWDSSIVKYDTIKNIAVANMSLGNNFGLTKVNNGKLTLSWSNPNPTTIPDGNTIFEICFLAIGPPGSMSPVAFTNIPLSMEATRKYLAKDSMTTVTPVNGKIIINKVIFVTDTVISGVNCTNPFGGKINITVSGGVKPYFFTWKNENGMVVSNSEDLTTGTQACYSVRIQDSAVPPHTSTDTFCIPGNFTVPIAKVLPPFRRVINCLHTLDTLSGIGSTTLNTRFNWEALAGGSFVSGQNTLNPVIKAAGKYLLYVTDTFSRCSAESADTIFVTVDTIRPVIDIGVGKPINCYHPTDTLGGALTSTGALITYEWKTVGGNFVSPTNVVKSIINKGGAYSFKVTNTSNGCFRSDSITVSEDLLAPTIAIIPAGILTCADTLKTLNGTGSSTGARFTYKWTTITGNIVTGQNSIIATANAAGVYNFIVKDTVNGCTAVASDSISPDNNLPTVVVVGNSKPLSCKDSILTLSGNGSTTGSSIKYKWTTSGTGHFTSPTNILNVTVDSAGSYQLEVRDTVTGCKSIKTLVVTKNITPPNATAFPTAKINCSAPTAILNGTGSSLGPKYSYNWTSSATGHFVSGISTLNPVVDSAGTYFLVVRDTVNGCRDTATVVVTKNTILPLANVTATGKISCSNPTLALSGAGSSVGANFTYMWMATNGGAIIGANNQINATALQSGTFILTVKDSTNNCIQKDTIIVTGNKTLPVVKASTATVTCKNPIIDLNSLGTSVGTKYSYAWTTTNGNIIAGTQNTISAKVDINGTYKLIVTDTTNNCKDSVSVAIGIDKVKPVADAGADGLLTCQITSLVLDGQNSASGTKITYFWTSANGGNITNGVATNAATINKAGTYTLLVKDTVNGCSATDVAIVTKDTNIPTANIVQPDTLRCPNSVLVLSGAGSSTGANFSYLWTSVGGSILAGANTLNASVKKAGIYILTVTNSVNSCQISDTVFVAKKPDLPNANAGSDQPTCTDNVVLTGNTPTGTTGVWADGNGTFLNTVGGVATAENLFTGENIFYWKLSTAACPNYATDTVVVTKINKPLANNDAFVKPFDINPLLVNLTKNDVNGGGNIITAIVNPLLIGSLALSDSGKYAVTTPPSFFGELTFSYSICSELCPNLCDTADVKIKVEPNPDGIEQFLPNAITPNADGKNDVLIFDVITYGTTEQFPDNELVVFNRWGDIVYQTKPYTNNWGGTNKSGQLLPHGTYYYILKLNITKGLVYRGDITILK